MSCALGVVLGLFPILGSTTLLCFLAAYALKLNQPATQAVNQLMYPLQIPLVLVFVRMGEKIIGAPPVPLAPARLASEFSAGPAAFLREYGLAGLHGILAWTLTAPLLAVLLYSLLVIAFRKIQNRPGKSV